MRSLSIFPSTALPCHFLFKDDNRDLFFLTFRQIHLLWMYLTTPPQSFFPLWPCLCWQRGSLPLSPFSLLLSFCWTVIISSTTSIPGPQWLYRGSIKFYLSSRLKDISIIYASLHYNFRPLSLLRMDHSTGIFSTFPRLSTCTWHYTLKIKYWKSTRAQRAWRVKHFILN